MVLTIADPRHLTSAQRRSWLLMPATKLMSRCSKVERLVAET